MRHQAVSLMQASCLAAALALSGCRVESDKHGGGDDVKVATPFGGMQVKTNESIVADEVGIPVYPGAVPIKKDDGKDSSAADVNMSFGGFQMRIKALSFHSDDDADKIERFYRNALKKYGDVVVCEHDHPVGTPTQTSQGLTCDNKKSNHISVSDSGSGKMELKAGSQQHQHIVGIDKDGVGTKIGLVSLDLPGHLSFGRDHDSDKQ